MTGRSVPSLALAAALLAGAGAAVAQSRNSLFPKEGCSSLSRLNPCGTRQPPSPSGDPTRGPLTDPLRQGPLDPPPDPLGRDAVNPPPKEITPQTLPSQEKDEAPGAAG